MSASHRQTTRAAGADRRTLPATGRASLAGDAAWAGPTARGPGCCRCCCRDPSSRPLDQLLLLFCGRDQQPPPVGRCGQPPASAPPYAPTEYPAFRPSLPKVPPSFHEALESTTPVCGSPWKILTDIRDFRENPHPSLWYGFPAEIFLFRPLLPVRSMPPHTTAATLIKTSSNLPPLALKFENL